MTSETTPTYKPTVRHIYGTQYDVQSRTRPERVHHVDTYHLACSCEAASFGKRCWALAVALSYEQWRRHEEAKAQAERLAARQAAAAGAAFGVRDAAFGDTVDAQPGAIAQGRTPNAERDQTPGAAHPNTSEFHASAGYRGLAECY